LYKISENKWYEELITLGRPVNVTGAEKKSSCYRLL